MYSSFAEPGAVPAIRRHLLEYIAMTLRKLGAFAIVCCFAVSLSSTGRAQEPPKPGPEHEHFKKYVGTWEATMKMGGADSKGTSTYKMDLGGLWLSSTFEGEVFGTKFQGKGMDTYDTTKKKYVALWCDSMSTSPMIMEGAMDDKKVLTLTGDSPGPDGKPIKAKSVTEWKSDDHFVFHMYMGDVKEPAFTIEYKRKK
jgi:hypothetical protein